MHSEKNKGKRDQDAKSRKIGDFTRDTQVLPTYRSNEISNEFFSFPSFIESVATENMHEHLHSKTGRIYGDIRI